LPHQFDSPLPIDAVLDVDCRSGATASGTPYDPRAFSAASRTLPFGTVLRVQRPDTGAAVIVRVNDRGPFRAGRIIDLSHAAAREIGMHPDRLIAAADHALYDAKKGGKNGYATYEPKLPPEMIDALEASLRQRA
jgi:rare lipoprotein A